MAWFKAQGVFGISSDGDDRMEPKVKTQKIPRASSKTQKNPWTKNWPPKNPMPILWPLKVPERGNAITQRKTLEIEHLCLFIHYTIWIYPFPHLLLFTSPQKIPTQIKLPKPNFRTQKKSRNRKFQTQNNPSIIPVTWNPEYPPPPLGFKAVLIWILHFPKPNYWYIAIYITFSTAVFMIEAVITLHIVFNRTEDTCS